MKPAGVSQPILRGYFARQSDVHLQISANFRITIMPFAFRCPEGGRESRLFAGPI